jgi:hypothetical protein
MADKVPFTIEILGFGHDRPVVLDRVIGGSAYFEEAKRIGQHLFSIADEETRPQDSLADLYHQILGRTLLRRVWVIGRLPGLANQSQSFLTGRSDSIHTRPFHHTYLNWCAIPN